MFNTGVPMLTLREALDQKFISSSEFEVYRNNGVLSLVVLPKGSIVHARIVFDSAEVRERFITQQQVVASFTHFIDRSLINVVPFKSRTCNISISAKNIIAFEPMFEQDGKRYSAFEIVQVQEDGHYASQRLEYHPSNNTWQVDIDSSSNWDLDPYYVEQLADIGNHPYERLQFEPTFPPIVQLESANDL